MLSLPFLESLESHLLALSAVVDDFEQGSPQIARTLLEWIRKGEALLQEHGKSEVSELARLRSVLVSAERGAVPPHLSIQGRPTKRKVRDALVADIVSQAETVLTSLLRPEKERYDEARRILSQVVAVALYKGTIQASSPLPPAQHLQAMHQQLAQSSEFGEAVAHVSGMIGTQGVLIVLSQTLVALTAATP